MNRTLKFLSLLIALTMLAGCGGNGEPDERGDRAEDDINWQYISADEVKEMIESGADAIYLDIQPQEDYDAGHLPNTMPIYAYPVDTPELEAKVKGAVSALKASDDNIVVICPGGGGGAKRTISILIEEGIDESRLLILEGGANGWPYPEMLITDAGEASDEAPDKDEDEAEDKAEDESLGDVQPVEKSKVYVAADWVNSVISGGQTQSQDYVVIECAWGEAEDGSYLDGHIPGAVHLNTDWIEEEDYWNIRTPEEIEELMKKLGITKDTVVIGYSEEPSAAGRAAFVFLWAGVEEVHVLDGGLSAWESAGYSVETDNVELMPTTEDFGTVIPAHPEYVLAMPEDVIEAQKDDNFRLVSIRSWEEFIGETSGYGYIDRAGEPEGAVWGHDEFDYVNSDGTVKELSAIEKELWDEWDIGRDNTISFYCGTGWRATIPFLICYENAWDNVSLFDGGWFVWQMDESLPVQTGDPRA